MTTALPVADASLEEMREQLRRQEKRIEMLELALFEATAPTIPMKSVPPPPAPSAETRPIANLETPPGIAWPDQREVASRAKFATELHTPRGSTTPRTSGFDPHSLLSSLDDVIWSISPDAQFIFYLAGAVDRLYGRPATQLQDSTGGWLEVVPEPDRCELAAALRRLTERERFEIEHRITTPTGTTRWVVSRGQLVRDWSGKPLRVDGITIDETNRTQPARTLQSLFERIGPATGDAFLQSVVQEIATAFDSRGAMVVCPDPKYLPKYHTRVLWLDGRHSAPLTFDVDSPFLNDLLTGSSRALPESARDHLPTDPVLAILRADCAIAEPLLDQAGTILGGVVVFDDRSRHDGAAMSAVLRALAPRIAVELSRPSESRDRVKDLEARLAAAEEQLRKVRGLETVGRLVAGVAHDFNNLLTVISGNAEVVRELLPANDPVRAPAELIATTANTAAGVARQLVSYGKPRSVEAVPLDANAVIRNAERLLHRVVGDRIELDLVLTPGLPAIKADPGQFDQVLLNLVANARDAIPENGSITIRTAIAEVGPQRPGWPHDLPGGVFVALTVADTGIGMTDDIKARIFDPYFSTKGESGSGVGLATVHDIMRSSGGHIEVESSPEWGTSIRVYWPKTDSTAVIGRPKPRTANVSGGETVLVVQDGDTLRDVTVMALQQAGYRVLEAADAQAAEERALFYAGPIQLLVADVGLPRCSGPELAQRLRQDRPELRVLFVSGAPPPELGAAPFLAKPYSPAELLQTVRQVLEA